jgi:hypothetical protein
MTALGLIGFGAPIVRPRGALLLGWLTLVHGGRRNFCCARALMLFLPPAWMTPPTCPGASRWGFFFSDPVV